ncbi:MAG: MCE family protein [Bdellovibrionales bacterium]|nr:MCE family protein [Bdellovibrionales bacterium]
MNQKGLEFKAGLFTVGGIALFISALMVLGGGPSWFKRQQTYFAHFDSVDGLIPGAKVVLSGLQVGTVDDIFIDREARSISVKITVEQKYQDWMRQGATAAIATMGVLGDKFIRLTPGKVDGELLANNATIEVHDSKDFNQVLNRGDQLLVTLNSIAGSMERLLKGFEKGNRTDQLAEGLTSTVKNLAAASSKINKQLEDIQLKEAVKNLNSILEKINNGQGTLGALINDPGLYDDAKALVGGANRSRIVRNMVRQTIQKSETENK